MLPSGLPVRGQAVESQLDESGRATAEYRFPQEQSGAERFIPLLSATVERETQSWQRWKLVLNSVGQQNLSKMKRGTR
jgi:hypothetical protein